VTDRTDPPFASPNRAFSVTCGANFDPLLDRKPGRDRALGRRGKAERLTLLARPGNSGESVIAVELAHDPDDSIDRLEVRPSRRIVHGAVGDEQRLIEPAHLQRQEFARWLGHTLRQDFPHKITHMLDRNARPAGDLGDREAAIQ
jgi:hypothetical protein